MEGLIKKVPSFPPWNQIIISPNNHSLPPKKRKKPVQKNYLPIVERPDERASIPLSPEVFHTFATLASLLLANSNNKGKESSKPSPSCDAQTLQNCRSTCVDMDTGVKSVSDMPGEMWVWQFRSINAQLKQIGNFFLQLFFILLFLFHFKWNG